jgi:hypothetical protein
MPAVSTRRRFLSQAAGVAAGGTVLALATIPPALAATAPASPLDPIFSLIERHRAASADYHEAVRIEFAFEESRMEGEKLRQYQILEAQTADACHRLDDAGAALVNTPPTTLAGIAALCRYIEPLLNDPHMPDLPDKILWDDDTESPPAAALANSIAVAIRDILKGGAAGVVTVVGSPGNLAVSS